MTQCTFVKPTEELIEELIGDIREEDALELWNFSRLQPREAVMNLIRGSRDTKVVLADGKLMCMFGCVRHSELSRIGYPWLLATSELPKHSRVFLRYARAFLEEIADQYEVLENYGDAQNEKAVRWMSWLGFTTVATEPRGVDQIPFHKYEIRKAA